MLEDVEKQAVLEKVAALKLELAETLALEQEIHLIVKTIESQKNLLERQISCGRSEEMQQGHIVQMLQEWKGRVQLDVHEVMRDIARIKWEQKERESRVAEVRRSYRFFGDDVAKHLTTYRCNDCIFVDSWKGRLLRRTHAI